LDLLVPLKAVYFSDSLITLAFPATSRTRPPDFHRKQEKAKGLAIFLQAAMAILQVNALRVCSPATSSRSTW